MGTVCISVNTRNKTITQYHNYNFNSMCIWRGVITGVKDDGVYSINEKYDNDNGEYINAFANTLDSDLGAQNKKRLRFISLQYQTSGNILLSYMADRDLLDVIEVIPDNIEMKPHSRKLPTTRYVVGTYYRFKFENVSGSDFTIGKMSSNIIAINTGNSL